MDYYARYIQVVKKSPEVPPGEMLKRIRQVGTGTKKEEEIRQADERFALLNGKK